MRLPFWIALRYLKSRRVGRYAPLLTVTAISSIAIGMFALIVVMSIMRGFKQELTDRLLGFNAHITITKAEGGDEFSREEIEKIFLGVGVRDIAPFVQGEIIAQSETAGELLAQGARVRGIEPRELGVMSKVDFYFPEDSLGLSVLLPAQEKSGLSPAIIGKEISTALSLHPDFSDNTKLIAPLSEVLPNGELGPNSREFKVAGVFRTGIFDYDSKYILLSISDARKLLGLQAESGWQIRITDPENVAAVISRVKPKLPAGAVIEGFNDQNKKLFAALKLERIAMAGVLLMVMFIASFAIMGVVLLVTASKRKDIAILESIGMPGEKIGRIFLAHAGFIGALGSGTGFILGIAACLLLRKWPIKLPSSYYLDWLPVEINFGASVLFALVGVAVAMLASLYPVRQATRQEPVEVLRYE